MAQDPKPSWLQLDRNELRHGELHYVAHTDDRVVRRRLAFAGTSVLLVVALGTLGFHSVGCGAWSWRDCLYMVLITITTVGYSEVVPLETVAYGREVAMLVMLGGMSVSFYFLSSLTAFIIEGDLREALWRRKMQKRLGLLKGHYVVCGAGRTGVTVVEELRREGREVVVIERREEALTQLHRLHGEAVIAIRGDATDDGVLEEARVAQAGGLVTTLELDQDNLFVALSARGMNPDLRIVSRSTERATDKLLKAGANVVINPTHIGGRRMAHELVRPNVVGFLDYMVRDLERSLNIEEIRLASGSRVIGKKLSESKIREESNALVLAVVRDGEQIYNPPPQTLLSEGMLLIALGEREQLERLSRYVGGS
jgi:voltage-gated potassium channel